MKYMKCYEELMGVSLCPEHKHFDVLTVFKREEKKWNMTLTVD
jgi:hypothetical protein